MDTTGLVVAPGKGAGNFIVTDPAGRRFIITTVRGTIDVCSCGGRSRTTKGGRLVRCAHKAALRRDHPELA